MKGNLPQRRTPAHGIRETDRPPLLFVTICTKNRNPWLAAPDVHEILIKTWHQADAWLMGRYIIMPDHIHFLAACRLPEISLSNWISYWKSISSQTWKNPSRKWQSGYWDRRLRKEEKWQDKWLYIVHNPVRHKLAAHPDQWPFQSEIYSI